MIIIFLQVGAQTSPELDKELEKPRPKPVEDSWANKKHSPAFSSSASLSSAKSETAVNTMKSVMQETEVTRFGGVAQQSVVEIDLDGTFCDAIKNTESNRWRLIRVADTNWEADFEEEPAWPAQPKGPPAQPERAPPKPAVADMKPKPPGPAPSIAMTDLDEDTDVWDEDFEVPDTDVTIKLVKTGERKYGSL